MKHGQVQKISLSHQDTFNSFEDETRIRNRRNIVTTTFQFLWGWNRDEVTSPWSIISITFNSFEDETGWTNDPSILSSMLSIPLRMKQDGQTIQVYCPACFQFLWGWNPYTPLKVCLRQTLSIPLRMKHIKVEKDRERGGRWIFQFLWGWNYYILYQTFWIFILSIPLRMKLTTKWRRTGKGGTFQFLWGWNIQ